MIPAEQPRTSRNRRCASSRPRRTRATARDVDFYNGDRADFPECRALGHALYDAVRAHARRHRRRDDLRELHTGRVPPARGAGFCGRGEARDFIKDGNIEIGGKTPVNTNGGLLGEGYIHGVNNILEGVRQMRGTAPNQVPNAEHTLGPRAAAASSSGRAQPIAAKPLDRLRAICMAFPRRRSGRATARRRSSSATRRRS